MHIFRHATLPTTVGTLARACRRAVEEGDAKEALPAAARLESGATDAWARPSGDGWGVRERALTALSRAAAAWLLGLASRPLAALEAAMAALPMTATATAQAEPEGLRYYSATPEGYAAAAKAWRRAHAKAPVWVLGLRTMGSVMAPVAAAAIDADRLVTLRPRGAPDDRHIAARAELEAAMRQWRGEVLVVDEGPGLSGSSFGGAMQWLRRMGIATERITLLTSWAPDAGAARRLNNRYAARNWHRWQVRAAEPLKAPVEGAEEMSGGRWRAVLGVHTREPVWGQHERRKLLLNGGWVVAKFGGWGEYGQATLERARRLAEAGWGPQPAAGAAAAVCDGWILYQRESVRPLTSPTREWCGFAGRYLAWTAMEFLLEREATPTAEMEEMAKLNVERLLGVDFSDAAPVGPRTMVDGRMAAVEWGVRSNGGWVKFDGTDHGDDPFFPGPADIAWDLAGVGVEFGASAGEAAAAAYCRASGESPEKLAPRLAWHRVAYSSFRAAFCHFAAGQTEGAERVGFRAAAARYTAECGAAVSDRTGLRRKLHRWRSV